MKIGGLQKISLIDYPGRISAIVFTQGCNFRCPYCHNPELVDPAQYGPILPEEEVFSFLERRRGELEAVTVTGGEPTLQTDLEGFLKRIKKMGYLVKVDTNGSNPTMLERLIRGRWVNYLALDVKGPLHKYGQIAKAKVETAKILRSIELIAASGIEHEFRTTVVRSQLGKEDLIATAKLLKRGLYVLQPYVPVKCLDKEFLTELSYSAEEFSEIRRSIKKKQLAVVTR
ncbi:MAG: anaerobic ribonucleoside-triphosphate reductase activating protein [Syntrophaceae bacterium CG2_30_58_14]|nr:MAG: anaerobic ribonucleoside-triphosphate reductase activating protein [Syntrophaceae bacterium CG2_30_58_14]